MTQSMNDLFLVLDRVSYPSYFSSGSGSFGYGSTWKSIKIQNVKTGNSSTTLLIIGFCNYRENHIKNR